MHVMVVYWFLGTMMMTMFSYVEEKSKKFSNSLLQHLWVLVWSHQLAQINVYLPKCAIDTLGSGRDFLAFTVSVIENSDQILDIGFSYQGHPNH